MPTMPNPDDGFKESTAQLAALRRAVAEPDAAGQQNTHPSIWFASTHGLVQRVPGTRDLTVDNPDPPDGSGQWRLVSTVITAPDPSGDQHLIWSWERIRLV